MQYTNLANLSDDSYAGVFFLMISFLEKESTEVSASRDPVLDNRKGPAKAGPLPYQGFDSIPPFAAKAKQGEP